VETEAVEALLGAVSVWIGMIVGAAIVVGVWHYLHIRDRTVRTDRRGVETAYVPSHWRETLHSEYAQTIVGVTLHPDDAEEWDQVEIRPTGIRHVDTGGPDEG